MDGIIRVKGNRMSIADIIATIGISILLVAFILNSRKVISADKLGYNILNIVGAALCGYSAYLIRFYPFVVLETVWALVALTSVMRSVSRETPVNN
jgi:hypothetical protein